MQSSFRMSAILCGLLPLALSAGCTSYHPYGRYPGAYQYPQYQQPIPEGTVIPNNGNLGQPSQIQGSPGPGAAGPGANNGPAASQVIPRTQAKRDNTAPFGSEKSVPDNGYNDPRKLESGPAKGGPFGNENKLPEKKQDNPSPFGSGAGVQSQPSGNVQLANSNRFAATPAKAGFQPAGDTKVAGVADNDRFSPPRTLGNDTNAQPIGTGVAPAGATPSPYAYDAKTYSWLRGKVDYDEGSKTWQIIYSVNPNDQYGGSLTLMDHPRLKQFRNDDVAYLEGEIDTSAPGKPRYKISLVDHPLAPKVDVEASKPGGSGIPGPAVNKEAPKVPTGGSGSPFGSPSKSPF